MSRLAIFLLSLFLILPLSLWLAFETGEDSILAVAMMGCFLWWVWPRPPKEAPSQSSERPAWQDAPEPRVKPDWTALEADVRVLQKEVQQLRAEVTVLKSRLGQQTSTRGMAMPQAARSEAEKAPPVPDAAFSLTDAFPLPPPITAAPAAENVAPGAKPESAPKSVLPLLPAAPPDAKPEVKPKPKPILPPLPATPRDAAFQPAPSLAAEDKPPFKLPAFFTENLLLKAGIAILFLGLAFLLRYVSGHIHISVPMRYLGVVFAALALAYIGWRLRNKRRDYALAVQGAALAILYLTTLAALKLHHLVAPLPAVVLMAALSAALVALAVRQNAQVLAQVALVGALAAPVLTSSGNNHYLALFIYLALVNSAVVAIAWFKSWRLLNLTALTGTFAIAVLWGGQYYAGEYFAAVEGAIFYHVLLYTLAVCFHARHQLQGDDLPRPADDAPLRELLDYAWRGISYVGILDSGLLFASAFAAFALQYLASAHLPYGAAGSAAVFALFYAVAGFWAYRRGERLRPLFEGLVALAAVFATLAVPLAFDSRWAVATWGVQAALAYAFATRQQSPHGRLFALMVYALASLALLGEFRVAPEADVIVQGSLPNVLLHLAAGAVILWVRRDRPSARWETAARHALLVVLFLQAMILPLMLVVPLWAAPLMLLTAWGLAFWPQRRADALTALALVASALAAAGLYAAFGVRDWWALALLAVLTLPLAWRTQRGLEEGADGQVQRVCGWLLLLLALGEGVLAAVWQPWFGGRMAFWLMPAFAVLLTFGYFARWRQARWAALAFTPLWLAGFVLHVVLRQADLVARGEWLLALALALLLHGAALRACARERFFPLPWLHALGFNAYPLALGVVLAAGRSWLDAAVFFAWLVPGMVALALAAFAVLRAPRFAYHGAGALPLVAWLAAVLLVYNLRHPGGDFYLPLLNFIELPTLLAAWLVRRWWRQSDLPAPPPVAAAALVIVSAWLWVSMLILRAAHHYFGVAWNTQALLASFGVQAALSLAWAIGAIALMLAGSRRGLRLLWQSGALLMGVVILKLFVVELGDSGGIARIVSFIGVGVLLLAVSYFAPAPRKEDAE